jgi:hypothetical protein
MSKEIIRKNQAPAQQGQDTATEQLKRRMQIGGSETAYKRHIPTVTIDPPGTLRPAEDLLSDLHKSNAAYKKFNLVQTGTRHPDIGDYFKTGILYRIVSILPYARQAYEDANIRAGDALLVAHHNVRQDLSDNYELRVAEAVADALKAGKVIDLGGSDVIEIDPSQVIDVTHQSELMPGEESNNGGLDRF